MNEVPCIILHRFDPKLESRQTVVSRIGDRGHRRVEKKTGRQRSKTSGFTVYPPPREPSKRTPPAEERNGKRGTGLTHGTLESLDLGPPRTCQTDPVSHLFSEQKERLSLSLPRQYTLTHTCKRTRWEGMNGEDCLSTRTQTQTK